MKTSTLSVAPLILAAMLVTACKKEQPLDPTIQAGKPSMMTVRFENAQSKAIGAAVNESVITSGAIFVFRQPDGLLDGMQQFTSTASPINVKITSGMRDVYVVANATGANFSLVQNLTDLYDVTNKYSYASIDTLGTSLPMSGMTLNQDATAATTATPLAVSVNLSYLCSKVSIGWDISQVPSDMQPFTVTRAYMINVPNKSDYFVTGADNLTSHVFSYSYGRENVTGFSGSYLPALPTYTNTYQYNLRLSDITKNGANHFYVFENKVAASPTIMVIEGTVTKAAVTTTYYYPLIINGSQNTTGGNGTASVVRGKNYTITASIKGFGNSDPYEPITNAALDVTIVAATWSPVTITQDFN